MWFEFRPYVPVAQRKAQAAREVEKRRKKGQAISPVVIEGRQIATTFWGKAWCDNLESYSDYANRLPRGRTYVRNGSVVDLQIKPAKVTALVSGSEMYKVEIAIEPLSAKEWDGIKKRCAGQVGSVVELLQGKLSKNTIEVVTAKGTGLFPKPREITMECSCPDWAGMCKHVAAVMYGIGARLDHQPELLFVLRKVDHLELIDEAVAGAVGKPAETTKKTLSASDVAGVFGIEMAPAEEPAEEVTAPAEKVPAAKTARAKAAPITAKNTKATKSKPGEKKPTTKRRKTKEK